MSRGRLLSLGSVNVDFQVRVDRWPGPGETLTGEDFIRIGGGKAFNRAWLGKRFGVDSELLARLGDDDLAEDALGPLREMGVGLDHTHQVVGCSTAVSMIFTRADGDKSIVLAPNANERWTDDDAEEVVAVVRRAPSGSVLSCDLEVPTEIVRAAVRTARDRDLRVVLDPSPSGRVDDELLRLATHVTPNAGEAGRILGREVEGLDDAEQAAHELRDRGVEVAIVKSGGEGCVVVDGEGAHRVEGLRRDVVDTTGAGDAFAAALSVALLDGETHVDAARFAMATAALAVTGWGSHTAYPTRDEVERAMRR